MAEALTCSLCARVQPPSAYSKSQAKKNAARRCLDCISGVNPPPEQTAAASAKLNLELCWGCGVEQGDVRFKQCPLCAADKVCTGFFCGKDCLVKNWKRHKLWHEKMAQLVALTGESPEELLSEEREHTRKEREARRCREAERGAPKDCPEYDALLAQGAQALGEMRLSDAKGAFDEALLLDASRSEAHHNLGTLFAQKTDYVPATRHYLQAMELQQRGTQLWALAATSAYMTIASAQCKDMTRPKWMRSSEGLLEMALLASEACPNDSKALAMVGDAQMRLGQCESASSNYTLAAHFAETDAERLKFTAQADGHVPGSTSRRGKAKGR